MCVLSVTAGTTARAQTTEYFNVGAFQAAAGQPVQVIGFDDLPNQDGPATLTAYQSLGLTIRNRDGFGINVVRNLQLPYGLNFVSPGLINSAPNVISSGFKVNTAVGSVADNLDFDFSVTTRAAGVWIGSLGGGGCELTTTAVEFRDASDNLLAAETLDKNHVGVIPTTLVPAASFSWDNRVFYGIVSTTPIARIRVTNGGDGCDVISFDDVQFVPPPAVHPVTIDPGTYAGTYSVLQNLFSGSGTANLSLTAGTYFVDNASGGRFSFDVTSSGSITNISNPDAAYALDNVLHFNTVEIHVDPQQYRGQYLLLGHCCSSGPGTFNVIANLRVYFDNFSGGRFSFLVESGGTISGIDNTPAASAVGNTLVLNNVNVSVDPQAYVGTYQLLGLCCASGPRTFVVIPNLQVYFDNFAGDRFSFFVSDVGVVSSIANPAAATAAGSTLILNNSCVQIDPGTFTGAYFVQGQTAATGPASFVLITGMSAVIVGSDTPFLVTASGPMPNTVDVNLAHQLHSFSLSGGTCDNDPPSTSVSSASNLNDWQTAAVAVLLSAQDAGGSGVKGIYIEESGATTVPSHLVNGGSTTVSVSNEGLTNISFFAVDNAGNQEAVQIVTVKIDRSNPTIDCAPAPPGWHATNVSIACSAADLSAGIQGPTTFSLVTNVAVGSETTGAQTDSRSVCDIAGNCANADPIGGIQVDRRAPSITITSPAGQYTINQVVTAAFSCSDGGSGLNLCNGSVANGQPLNTSSAGPGQFTVNASDAVGNTSQSSASYSVGFATRTLHDEIRPVKSGATIPLKVQVIDASGVNLSAATIQVTATALYLVAGDTTAPLQDSGSSNPDNNFRYSDGQYIYNLKTTGLATGRWRVSYLVAGDSTVHYTFFQVR
jgi:hypothetical protein